MRASRSIFSRRRSMSGMARGVFQRRAVCSMTRPERGAVVANLFRFGLFVQYEVGADGHAQPAGCQVEIEFAVN